MFLSIIIPAYNEEERIKKTLIEVNNYLIVQHYNYEIIVIDDGSTDNTVGIVRKLPIANLKIINNPKNHGKGYVVRQGLLLARGEYRLFTDADSSTPINQIEKLLPHAKRGIDIVIGSRGLKDSRIIKMQSLQRRIMGIFYRLLVRIIAGLWGIKDTQCGFKLLSASAIIAVLPKCKINGWSFDSEILVIAKRLGYAIKEVPITWSNYSQTKMNVRGMAQSILDLLKIRWNLITKQYKL